MVRGGNGYVTVNVGVSSGRKKLLSGALQSTDVRNRRAIRLRSEGWSYRHISVELNMSYASVCDLLDGEEARLPPTPLPVRFQLYERQNRRNPVPEQSVLRGSDSRMDQLAAQISALQARMDLVVTMQNSLRKRLSQLEEKILSALKDEHRVLGQHLQSVIKTLLARVLPQTDKPKA